MLQRIATSLEASELKTRTCYFLLYCALAPLLFYGHLEPLVSLSLNDNRYTHILAVPVIVAALIFLRRNTIFAELRYAVWPGVMLGALAVALCGGASIWTESAGEGGTLAIAAAGIVMSWIAGFVFFYGTSTTANATFPIALLGFAVPIPPAAVEIVEVALQRASGDVAHLLFQLSSTPFVREDLLFFLPNVTIEVARECSGIRSAIALLITTLVLSYVLLRSGWSRLACVLLAAPIAIFKNAVRIVTLSMLAVHVSPEYLHGPLHHRGGPVFSMLSLALLAPVLWALWRWENGGVREKTNTALPVNQQTQVRPSA